LQSRPTAMSESERSDSFTQFNPKTGHRISNAKGGADIGTVDARAELIENALPMKKAERLLGVRLGFRRRRN
jgi:hypothetical protein